MAQVYCRLLQVKANIDCWALQGCRKRLALVTKRTWGFGTAGKPGITFSLIALKPWTNRHPRLLGFRTGKSRALWELVQGMISPWPIRSSAVAVRPCMPSGSNGYWGNLGKRFSYTLCTFYSPDVSIRSSPRIFQAPWLNRGLLLKFLLFYVKDRL